MRAKIYGWSGQVLGTSARVNDLPREGRAIPALDSTVLALSTHPTLLLGRVIAPFHW